MSFGPPPGDPLTPLPGGITAAPGYRAIGVTAGLKASGRPDLALVASDGIATAAATVTTNRFRAAPCDLTVRHVADGRARAVVINSGNANACTGERGRTDAHRMSVTTAEALGCAPDEVLVCSTGVIGVPLEMEPLTEGIRSAAGKLAADGGPAAAEAIMTTDTVPKETAYRVLDDRGSCVVGAMAKGAGMIEPQMATMLSVIATDAPLEAEQLRRLLRRAVDRTFNRISVDAAGSTNDTVIALAGRRGEGASPAPRLATLEHAFERVCADLAQAIVADGEASTRMAEIHVRGARTEEDAVRLGRAVAASVLFRASLHGRDPNWGRILAAMGATTVPLQPERVDIYIGPADRPDEAVTVCVGGAGTDHSHEAAVAALGHDRVAVTVELGLGTRNATFLSADLTPQYVVENAHYTT